MYNKLKTKYINKYNTKHIDKSFFSSILKHVINVCPFSTFGYVKGYNSNECLDKTNSGNCVSLSMLITRICNHHNVISFLIPSTVPKKYFDKEYLDISHVAVCIPFASYVYILDPAFYFMEPMMVNFSSINKNNQINSYDIESDKISKINYKLIVHLGTIKFNYYQSLPENTLIVECNYLSDNNDKWNYFLVEILNPDEAISSFYITKNQLPFLASVNPDYSSKHYIEFLDNNTISVKENYKLIYKGDPKKIKKKILRKLAPYKLDFSLPKNIGYLDFNIV